jgi:hypothetical protein
VKKERFERLLESVKQAGKIMRGKKLPGMRVSYRLKPRAFKRGVSGFKTQNMGLAFIGVSKTALISLKYPNCLGVCLRDQPTKMP